MREYRLTLILLKYLSVFIFLEIILLRAICNRVGRILANKFLAAISYDKELIASRKKILIEIYIY